MKVMQLCKTNSWVAFSVFFVSWSVFYSLLKKIPWLNLKSIHFLYYICIAKNERQFDCKGDGCGCGSHSGEWIIFASLKCFGKWSAEIRTGCLNKLSQADTYYAYYGYINTLFSNIIFTYLELKYMTMNFIDT